MKQDLLFPELSYKIVGAAFDVFNKIGGGHKEIIYHKALAIAFTNAGLNFKEEFYGPLKFDHVTIGKKFFDFFVEDKIIIEIKSADRFVRDNFVQILDYLNSKQIKLGLLIAFGRTEVKYKRILNIDLLNKEKQNVINGITN